ncbi:PAS domain S-box protein [Pontibacter sp. 172403-2]|uniref:PAS domain S-box protein n=1 Tax=Pontibacter rufus TaxID=2791028 RepID=UPI0018AFACE4|nr:PAS domain S-box protein [Pontibacter sp. 172403-2]MBF9252662.1 PAS domain S-box protein [Pontibacter sp. 172403-2]
MPYLTDCQPGSSELTQQADALLQVLAQLAPPVHRLAVALPSGQVLALKDGSAAQQAKDAARYAHELLGISEKAFAQLVEELQEQKKITGELPQATDSNCAAQQYNCRLLQYQGASFVCLELPDPGQPSALVPSDGDSYYSVFEDSSEPLFILDCDGCFIDVNRSAMSLVHQQKEALLHKSILRSFGLNLFERVSLKGQLQQALAGTPQKFEWWLREKNNDLLPVEITLQKGTFQLQDVILGSAKNLNEVIDMEQNMRFRNNQLEFINQLLTNLSSSDSQQEVLKSTLNELLQKSDVTGGCVYTYSPASEQLRLTYTTGKTEQAALLPEELHLEAETARQLITSQKRKALADTSRLMQEKLNRTLTLVPVTSDQELLAIIALWPADTSKMSQSFAALLDFIGEAIGNYIAQHQLQHQLNTTADKYKLLFEASYDAILLFSSDGVVRECNEKALKYFRCSRKDLINKTPNDFSPEFQPDGMRSSDKVTLLMEQVLKTGAPITFEWKNRRSDGTLFDSEINISRIMIDGEYYVQAFKRDITKRKAALLARRRAEIVQESMEQFRNFMDKVNLVYFSLDTGGNITSTNDYFLKYTEYSREELLGQNFYKLLVQEQDRESRFGEFVKILETRQLNAYYERDIVTKSGQLKTIRWNCMLEYGPDGEVTGITSVGKDMTDKRIAMEALKDNKIRLQDLFDNAHDLIQNISVDNKFIFVNRAWKERLGYSDQDIESLTLDDIVHPYYRAKLIYQLRNLYKGEYVNKIETVFLTKAGKPVHLIGSINCSWQDGQPVATRAILHDITDRIKAERLQKVYYSIANLAISSKDLNALYTAIHRELSKIIETRNIYIALCDNEHKQLHFVYFIDQFLDKGAKPMMRRPFSVGLSEYIIETGKPLYMQKEELRKLSEKEGFIVYGAMPEVILCSPLAIGDRIIGVITLQDYQNADAYVQSDIEILHFISNQVALAIERKRNEEQINNQNARLNAIFESGTHHMWSLNRNFELTSFNRNFASTFAQRSGEELQPFTRLDDSTLISLHENSYTFWHNKYQLAFEGQPQHFEIHLQYPESWREVYLNPIYLEDGSFEEISGIALDITDKKGSQLALAENEEKFRHIFESFQDVYYRVDMNGILELVSPSVTQLLGYREEEIIGRHSSTFYANPTDHDKLKQRVMAEGPIRDIEVEMVDKDGFSKTVLLDSRLVFDKDGNAIALEGVLRDVSELKRTQVALLKAKEEAENLLKVKTQFLANMSHELRTPMNGIIGMIDLLSQINHDPEQGEYIDTLRKSSDALLAILNDILDLSKMQAGKLVLHEGGVDLEETLGKIFSLFSNRAQHKDLSFSYNIASETPRHIITDETRLLQILSNLTSNAIKFTNAGEVSIKVSSKPLKGKEHLLHVRVKDSGIGISKEDQDLLFTDFTQLDNSSTKTFGGTGLGLAISRQLTQLLGGDIGVESESGSGSTFWFNIKVREATAAEIAEQAERQRQPMEMEQLKSIPNVLLVDDNQINQKVAEKQLERIGCQITIASDGFEAIALATANKYDIIFMDIQMPEMDGVTATNLIKEKLGSDCPPIIAMTAYSMKDDAEKFMGQGMDDYVSKPVKSADLHAMISKWQLESWHSNLPAPAPEEATEIAQDIIDLQVVEQLRQIGGDEFARQMYIDFEHEAAELLEEAKKELQAQHYNSILSTLHQLKGTGFTLGINQLAELAKQLEHDIKQDRLDHVSRNFSKLLEQYENYRKIYTEIIL